MIELGKKEKEYPTPEWVKRGNLRWSFALWEPLLYYKRLGIYGNYEWLEEWYLHAHEKETVKKLSEAGINCVSTHFFKGFGLKAEHKEIERMRKFTQFCHEYRIKVFAYIQGGSLMYESFLDEVPEAKDWMVYDAQGRKKIYSSQYWRWTPCLNNSGFLSYIKNCIKRAIEAGADGIFLDNLLPRDCYCSRCQHDFREYLKVKAPFLINELNYSSFDNIEIPPNFYPGDPIGLKWRDFKNDVCLKFIKDIYQYTKRINKEIAVGINGYTFVHFPPVFSNYMDIAFVEAWFPRMEGERIATQYYFLNRANTLGINAITSSYDFNNGGNLYFPSLPSPNQIKRNIAESAFSGGHTLSSFWAMLPDKHSSKCAFEDKERYNTLKNYNDFFSKYKHLINPRRTLAKIALMHSYSSFSLGGKPVIWEGRCMQQFCIEHNLDYDVILSEDLSLLDEYNLLLLPDICAMSDKEIEKITQYVKNGGHIIATRRTSLYDENLKERRDYGLSEVFGYSYGEATEKLQVNNYGAGWAMFIPGEEANITEFEKNDMFYNRIPDDPVWAQTVIDTLEKMCPSVFVVKVNQKRGVIVKSFELDNNVKAVHLLNFSDTPVEKIELQLSEEFKKIRKIELYTPDNSKRQQWNIPFEYRENGIQLTLPKLQTYCILVIT